jgi:hypothetical protein
MTVCAVRRVGGWPGAGLLALLTLAPGCANRNAASPEDGSPQVVRLQEIFRMAQMRKKGNQPPATRIEDFKQAELAYPQGFQALRSGACVFVWGAYTNPSADRATTVLAYEKEVPSQGGYVVMLDGKVKTMTAEEFNAAKPGR